MVLPCPDCCGPDPCTIFAAASFADLTGLTQIGTVAVAGGVATLEVGEGLIVDAVPTNATDPVHLAAVVSTTDDPATLRLAVARADADNYLFGEFDIDTAVGTLRLGMRSGGVETWLTDAVEVEDTTELGDETTVTLCWVPGAVVTGGSSNETAYPTIANSGDGWSSPENILVDDGSWASYLLLSAGTTTTLIAANFPFVIPPGSTIDGIEVGVEARYTDLGGDATLTMLQLQGLAGLVGDDRGTGQAVTEQPASSVVGSGGAADDWSAGLTWEDINSPDFGVQMQFDSDGGAIIEVDYVVITVYFTSPNQQPGRLTLSYQNVGGATINCSREFYAEAPGTGKKAMILSGGGDWDVHSLTYSYHESASKPTCPACECTVGTVTCPACCDESEFQESLVVDFGAGGWTNDDCTAACTQVVGEILLPFGHGSLNCLWFYQEEFGTCDSVDAVLTVWLWLQPVGDECRWLCVVEITNSAGTTVYARAYYTSGEFATNDETNCETFPVTLDKLSETPGSCGGTLPATITIDIP